jgi:hypothetical protein
VELIDKNMIFVQNIAKKAISYWRKYFGDFIAQKVGFPYSQSGRPDARVRTRVTPQIWASKFVSRNLRFPRDITTSEINSRSGIYFFFSKVLGIDSITHWSWLKYLDTFIKSYLVSSLHAICTLGASKLVPQTAHKHIT